ncbi:hypothetical protein NEUTE1DRAFT_42117, partial [Neurospora tetrasperma FGSC 2508]
ELQPSSPRAVDSSTQLVGPRCGTVLAHRPMVEILPFPRLAVATMPPGSAILSLILRSFHGDRDWSLCGTWDGR